MNSADPATPTSHFCRHVSLSIHPWSPSSCTQTDIITTHLHARYPFLTVYHWAQLCGQTGNCKIISISAGFQLRNLHNHEKRRLQTWNAGRYSEALSLCRVAILCCLAFALTGHFSLFRRNLLKVCDTFWEISAEPCSFETCRWCHCVRNEISNYMTSFFASFSLNCAISPTECLQQNNQA